MNAQQDEIAKQYAAALSWMAEHRCYDWPDWASLQWPRLSDDRRICLDGTILSEVDFYAYSGGKWHEFNHAREAWHQAWVKEWLGGIKDFLVLVFFAQASIWLGMKTVGVIWPLAAIPYSGLQNAVVCLIGGLAAMVWRFAFYTPRHPGSARRVERRLRAILEEKRPDLAAQYF